MSPQKFFDRVSERTGKPIILGLIVIETWLLSPNLAHAEGPRYDVKLSVEPSLPACDRNAEFLALLEPLVPGQTLDAPANRTLAVNISKMPGGSYGVDLAIKQIDGREVRATHTEFSANMECFEVLYRAAVRSASEIQRDLLMTPKSKKIASTQPVCPAPIQCPTPEPTKPEPPKITLPERNRFLGAGGMIAVGAAPETVFGANFILGWKKSPSFSFEVDLGATLPTDTRPLGRTTVRIYTSASLAFVPCYRIGSFGACGLIEGNGAVYKSIDVTTPNVATSWSLGVGGRGILDHHISERLSVRVNLDVVVPFVHMQVRDSSLPRLEPSFVNGNLGVSMLGWF